MQVKLKDLSLVALAALLSVAVSQDAAAGPVARQQAIDRADTVRSLFGLMARSARPAARRSVAQRVAYELLQRDLTGRVTWQGPRIAGGAGGRDFGRAPVEGGRDPEDDFRRNEWEQAPGRREAERHRRNDMVNAPGRNRAKQAGPGGLPAIDIETKVHNDKSKKKDGEADPWLDAVKRWLDKHPGDHTDFFKAWRDGGMTLDMGRIAGQKAADSVTRDVNEAKARGYYGGND